MKVPSDQSVVSRSEEKFEGKPGNGSPKPDMIEDAGRVLSFENHWIVVIMDNLPCKIEGEKADVVEETEGSSLQCVMTSKADTTVVLDHGMYSKG